MLHKQSKVVLAVKECLDGPPLDFSFKNIQDLEEVRDMQPRSGKRKEINIVVLPEVPEPDRTIQPEAKTTERKESNSQDHSSDAPLDVEEPQPTEKKQKPQDIKKSPDYLVPVGNQAANLIQTHNIPLNSMNGKVIGGKNQENKHNYQNQCYKINRICVSLVLCQNKIRSLANFYPVFEAVMFDVRRLQLLDISYNFLETLDYTFEDFPLLSTLYMNCNYIWNLEDISQLSTCLNLKSLSIYGNPIEQIPNVRLFVIGKLKHLKRVDSVLVSKKERDNAEVFIKQFKFQPRALTEKFIRKPPAVKVEQNQSSNDGSKSQL